MRTWVILAGALILTGAGSLSAEPGDVWQARLGRSDGRLEAQSYRLVQTTTPTGVLVETRLPAHGDAESKVTVELDPDGRLLRSRTDYLTARLAEWYRADFLLTEVQPGAAKGGGDNLAFQRVWKNEVQEAKNLAWGSSFVEFSTLPFVLERRLAVGKREAWSFQIYSADIPGTMDVVVQVTDRPLGLETRYAYPRWFREHWSHRHVLVAQLTARGDFKGAYPYPFFYAFTDEPRPQWIAAWGGNPLEPSFQWRN